jgi:putative ATP-dependent endonuclease of OLD family
MPRIRKIEIQNFRGIKDFAWLPSAGINCLIGPGDNGKSSILDAIDYCVGARRNIQFTDADFHRLDVEQPIRISITNGLTTGIAGCCARAASGKPLRAMSRH